MGVIVISDSDICLVAPKGLKGVCGLRFLTKQPIWIQPQNF